MTELRNTEKKADLRLYTAAVCRAVDAQAMVPQSSGGMGLRGAELMRRAAQFALDTVISLRPGVAGISVVCGKGNNGGDGYWLAFLAHRLGIAVQLVGMTPKEQLSGDALDAREQAEAAGLGVEGPEAELRYPVIVDALLGIGGQGEPRPAYAKVIQDINRAKAFVLSLDLPSGLNADTGEAGLAVQAGATVSFIVRNIGLYTGQGPKLCGQRFFSDLGVPTTFAEAHPDVPLRFWRPTLLEQLPVDAYKHQRGHVVIVGGCKGMGGAVILAAEAALRSGAGLVTVATDPCNLPGLQARVPEAMWVDPVAQSSDQTLRQVLARADVVILGPGLGRSAWAEAVLENLVDYPDTLLVDADGLYWIGQLQQRSRQIAGGGQLYLTPHGGEAAGLLDCSVQQVSSDRLAALSAMTARYNALGLIKGPGTVMGDGREQGICGHGNPGMATAGMGDVLAGLAGSLMAQHPADQRAAFFAAVLLHSAAGDVAAEELGMRPLTASAVIDRIGQLLKA